MLIIIIIIINNYTHRLDNKNIQCKNNHFNHVLETLDKQHLGKLKEFRAKIKPEKFRTNLKSRGVTISLVRSG